jgi:hypothetical protein
MSNQGFRGVPGVPEGWELMAIRHAEPGESFIEPTSHLPALAEIRTTYKRPIIRKIEVPKKYRPFANGAEYKPHRDRWVKIVSGDNNCGCGITNADIGGDRRIDGSNERSVCIWEGWMTFRDAFKCFTFDDGTPFGVEVTE